MNKFKIIIIGLLISTSVFANKNYNRQGIVIEDPELGLVWEDSKSSGTNKFFFKDGKKYCEDLELVGMKDWRLPNYMELMSLSDYGLEGYEESRPEINGIFKNVSSGYYWSLTKKNTFTGTNEIKYEDVPLAVYFSSVATYENDRTGKASVRCVREK